MSAGWQTLRRVYLDRLEQERKLWEEDTVNVKDLEPLGEGEPVYAPLYTRPLDTGGNIMRGILIGIALGGAFWGVFFFVLWGMR